MLHPFLTPDNASALPAQFPPKFHRSKIAITRVYQFATALNRRLEELLYISFPMNTRFPGFSAAVSSTTIFANSGTLPYIFPYPESPHHLTSGKHDALPTNVEIPSDQSARLRVCRRPAGTTGWCVRNARQRLRP